MGTEGHGFAPHQTPTNVRETALVRAMDFDLYTAQTAPRPRPGAPDSRRNLHARIRHAQSPGRAMVRRPAQLPSDRGQPDHHLRLVGLC